MKKIKIFECFAGIGAQHKALTNLKNNKILDYEVVGISEWYISAIIGYTLIHYNNEFHSFDISCISKQQMIDYLSQPQFSFSNDSKNPIKSLSKLKLETLQNLYKSCVISKNFGSILSIQGKSLPKDIDVLTYSFPCQDLSQAGKKNGLYLGKKSGLIWEIGRILKETYDIDPTNLPKVLLMENVPTLFGKFKDGWNEWKDILNNLGYDTYDYILNSKNYNNVQDRRRAFGISIRKDLNKDFKLETTLSIEQQEEFNKILETRPKLEKLKDILENKDMSKYRLNTTKSFKVIKSTDGKTGTKFDLIDLTNYEIANRIYDTNYYAPTLTTSCNLKIYEPDSKIIRRLSPLECFLLMGFDESDYKIAKTILSENKMFFVLGNSIVVNVLEFLFFNINKQIFQEQD